MFAKKSLILTVCSLGILLGQTALTAAQNIEDLPGYSRMTVGQGFEDFLKNSHGLMKALADNKELSIAVLRSATLQSQIQSGKITLAELLEKYAPKQQVADNKKSATNKISADAQRMLAQAKTAVNSKTARQQAADDIADNTVLDENASTASENEIAAQLAIAAIVAENQDLADHFAANPTAYTDVLNGTTRIEDILAETAVGSGPAPAPEEENDEPEEEAQPAPPAAPPPAPVTVEKFILNAVPAANTAQLDANGWPKHLKVPAECPPPQAGVKYYHEGLTYDWASDGAHPLLAGYGAKGRGGYNAIAHAFKGGYGAHRWTHLTEVENFAVPIVTPVVPNTPYSVLGGISDSGGNGQSTVAIGTPSGLWEASVSHCPGDFNGVTPTGYTSLATPVPAGERNAGEYRCASYTGNAQLPYMIMPMNSVYAQTVLEKSNRCVIEPGKRYFYNLRVNLNNASGENADAFRERMNNSPFKRNGKPLFGLMLEDGGNLHSSGRPRYVGPCLDSGPYPLGYDSYACGESQVNDNPSSGLQAGTTVYHCYDPYNQLPAVRFARTFDPVSKRLTWTEGYRSPMYHHYMCEISQSGAPVATYSKVCAAHREGELLETAYTNPAFKRIEQCQFNPDNARFEWAIVSAAPELVRHFNQGSGGGVKTNYERPLEHDGCQVGSTIHPIGTKVKIICGGGRAETRECRARSRVAGDGNLLGTFVPVSVEGTGHTGGFVGDTYSLVVASNRCRYTFE